MSTTRTRNKSPRVTQRDRDKRSPIRPLKSPKKKQTQTRTKQPSPVHARNRTRTRSKSPKRSPRRTKSTRSNRLTGGLFKGSGSYGCGFLDPLATTGATRVTAPGKRIGKVMSRRDAETELAAMRPFMALDPKGQWGVYADATPLLVDSANAVESAGSAVELRKCDVKHLQHAIELAAQAQEKPPGQERTDYIEAMKATYELRKKQYAELKDDTNQKAFLEAHPEMKIDDLYDMFQLEYDFASAGDMWDVFNKLAEESFTDYTDVCLRVQAHFVAFSNLTHGLAAYHAGSLVHRDIKPTNIVLASGTHDAPGEYKFIDFGASLPLAEAKTSNYQANPYIYWPLYTIVVFAEIELQQKEEREHRALPPINSDDLLSLQQDEEDKDGGMWFPRWVNNASVYERAMKNLDKFAIGGNVTAVGAVDLGRVAALYADVFALYVPTLAHLYWALTYVRFTEHAAKDATSPAAYEISPPLQDGESPTMFAFASSELGGRVSAALAQLMVDVSCGVLVTASDAAVRFQRVVDMFLPQVPAKP